MLLPKNIHPSWTKFLDKKIIDMLNDIENKIGTNYYPEEDKVLRFLSLDLSNIKCVIIGMDPYPNSYVEDGIEKPVATGRSFEVDNVNDWNDKRINPSLKNILKNIYQIKNSKSSIANVRKCINDGTFDINNPNQLFDNLEKQGVLFLNSSFTVEPNKPNSHKSYWKHFSIELFNYINDYNNNIVWFVWGNTAKDFLSKINLKNVQDNSHPVTASFNDKCNFKDVDIIDWTGRKDFKNK